MSKRGTKRGRSDSDEHLYPKTKQVRFNQAIPFHGQRKNQSIQDYDDLIKSSTEKFRSKHLIKDKKNRDQLLKMCRDILNDELSDPYFHFTVNENFYDTVYNACQGLAKTRLISLLKDGSFDVGRKVACRNTMVVSTSEKILLHIERSNLKRYDLWLEVEQTSSLKRHLTRDQYGKICHYHAGSNF